MARIPFYGRGPAPQIARMNMQEATAPGRNWGAAFESIGQTVGQAVEKHREHKKAKKKERDFIDAFEARISKNPGFAESYGINSDDTEEIRLTGKIIYNSPEMRPVIQDFSRFQEKERARAGTTEYLDLMLPSQAETVEPSDSGIRDFFAQGRADAAAAGLGSIQSPSAFTARLEGMPPIKSPEAKQMLLGRQLELQKAETAGKLAERELAIKEGTANFAGLKAGLDVKAAMQKPTADLRKEFIALPSVKDYNKVSAAYEKVKVAAKGAGPADDISLIFGYMKILDPGSTVREGEFATAANAGGVDTKIWNLYNKLKTGERLTHDQREMFRKSAEDTAQAQFDELATYVDFYSEVAGRQNAAIEDIVPAEFLEIRRAGLSGDRAVKAPTNKPGATFKTLLRGKLEDVTIIGPDLLPGFIVVRDAAGEFHKVEAAQYEPITTDSSGRPLTGLRAESP
jgi:hypothetical protein